tara:strand:- start:138 stop:410 length:273 start_codon:yes stop_codon:yes gene_type:complete
MIPTIDSDFSSDWNEGKELSMQDIVELIEESDSHLILTTHDDLIKIGGYSSSFDALLMIMNFLLKNKSIARALFGYFIEHKEELKNDSCE